MICISVLFFTQKTAYEMRISDWSSDVCSSDLDHRLPPRHPADAGDHARTGDLAAIKVAGSELANFEKGRTWIEQPLDPLTREQLAAAGVAFARLFIAAQRRGGNARSQVGVQRPVMRGIGAKIFAFRLDQALQDRCAHECSPVIGCGLNGRWRSEEHTSELQSLMRISYAVFCLKKKNTKT